MPRAHDRRVDGVRKCVTLDLRRKVFAELRDIGEAAADGHGGRYRGDDRQGSDIRKRPASCLRTAKMKPGEELVSARISVPVILLGARSCVWLGEREQSHCDL
jgi:hypothetical protein